MAKGAIAAGPCTSFKRLTKALDAKNCGCLALYLWVEVYQFSVITESIAANLDVNKYGVALILMTLMIAISRRGVNNVGRIASFFIPIFIICYLGMGAWIFYQNVDMLPSLLGTVIKSAFTGHAAVGAFAGSTILIAASQGMRRSCYAGDVAVGYASVIHSETRRSIPREAGFSGNSGNIYRQFYHLYNECYACFN